MMTSTRPRPFSIAVSLIVATLITGACSNARIPGVYRLDIQQGNVVTKEMLERVEPGMDKRKVQFVLGTPLVVDVFREDRWDYIYTFEDGDLFGKTVHRRITVVFVDGRLAQIEGDTEQSPEFQASQPETETVVSIPDPKERGLLRFFLPKKWRTNVVESQDKIRVEERLVKDLRKAQKEVNAQAESMQAPSKTRETPSSSESAAPSGEPEPEEDKGFFENLSDKYGIEGEPDYDDRR